jgi:hypothetical protein
MDSKIGVHQTIMGSVPFKMMVVPAFGQRKASAAITQVRVNSLEAPTISSLTPPNIFSETTMRIVGDAIMMINAEKIFQGDTGNRNRGRQIKVAMKGK